MRRIKAVHIISGVGTCNLWSSKGWRWGGGAESPRGVTDRHIQKSLANCGLEALRRVWVKLRVRNR